MYQGVAPGARCESLQDVSESLQDVSESLQDVSQSLQDVSAHSVKVHICTMQQKPDCLLSLTTTVAKREREREPLYICVRKENIMGAFVILCIPWRTVSVRRNERGWYICVFDVRRN